MVTDSCRKKSLRTRNDRANGNELDDMNSREHVWSEAMRAESPTQNRDPLLHRLSPGEPLRLRGTRSRPGTRCPHSTRRSIPVFKAGLNRRRPPTTKESHSMPNITATLLAATVSCALLNVFPAHAQREGPSRIRGTIESVDGNNLTVTARDGTTQKIGLASDVVVTGLGKTTLPDG